MKALNTLLYILELLREVMRPGGLREWHRVDARESERMLRPRAPKGDSCYPHHARLTTDQLVDDEELW